MCCPKLLPAPAHHTAGDPTTNGRSALTRTPAALLGAGHVLLV